MKFYSVTLEIETDMTESEVYDRIITALNRMPIAPYLEYFDLDVTFDYEVEDSR